ncbi:MAG TPA: penicillin acylase family protein [Candidatus Binatia bacterium]|jgi:acyl-homoserine lactone acylase PvdQ|nr:penicillin acylase family protein [Candidatus Binatia bacterium]
MRTIVLILLALATTTAAQPTVGRYQEFGDATGFLNILPPGAKGSLNAVEAVQAAAGTYPVHVIDQLGMYGDLVYATPGLTEDRILDFFKDASFGVREDDIGRTYSPMAGVTVVRDAGFGVPHIYGTTRYATMFAQGYTGAEDRLFLMDVLRHYGRARTSEFLGGSPANQHMDREQLALAPYKEADLTAQIEAIRTAGPEGQGAYDDLAAYTAGVNQFINEALLDATKLPAEYPALQQVPATWKLEDAVAIASLVGGIFGKGGGGELLNHCGLKAMTTTLGSAATARAVFDDLHFFDDPEAPTSSSQPAPYMTNLGAVNPAAHPDVDCASLTPVDVTGPPLSSLLDAIAGLAAGLGFPGAMSNALLVGGAHTDTGAPVAVFGPQTAYFMPQILVEKDVHGPGIDARGASFAGTDVWVQLGRGRDYAFSATSAGADNIDQFVLRLCEPGGGAPTVGSLGYLRNGTCEPIERYQHVQIAKPSAGGIPTIAETQCNDAVDDDGDGFVNDGCPAVGLPELLLQCTDTVDSDLDGAVNDGCLPIIGPDLVLSWRVERTQHYGPLVARGTLTDGTPIAIATLRSTYRNELGSAIGFRRVNDPDYMASGFDAFRTAMAGGVDYTFNWFYIDARHIGYQHSCRCPQRAAGVDPYLPAWGTGQWDWQGFIPPSAQPYELDPAKGYLTSWNNKQAPQFGANDREFSYGPVYRSQMLDVRVEAAMAAGPVKRTDLIDAMEDAGTVDLRGQEVLALLLDVLGPTAPGGSDARAQDMRNRLATWLAAETHRRDHDHDGAYDDPQSPAIIDAWWPRLAHAIFDTTSGDALNAMRIGLEDGDRVIHRGSAFNGGVYGQVQKDLRRVLGRPVTAPWSRVYCGGGVLAACRTALWGALSQAAADLQTEFGSANVADWRRQLADEDVQHTAAGITSVPAIHWINRPTFQQVVQLPTARVLDDYACYKARGVGPMVRRVVQVDDAFGTSSTMLLKPDSFCTPVGIDGAPRLDPGARLTCYKTSGVRGFVRRRIGLDDAFGERTLDVVKPRTVCVPTLADGVGSPLLLDAFRCYQAAKASPKFARHGVGLVDAFGSRSALLVRPQQVCAAAGLDGDAIGDPSAYLACYRASGVSPRPATRSVAISNDVGPAAVTTTKLGMVCVRAARTVP